MDFSRGTVRDAGTVSDPDDFAERVARSVALIDSDPVRDGHDVHRGGALLGAGRTGLTARNSGGGARPGRHALSGDSRGATEAALTWINASPLRTGAGVLAVGLVTYGATSVLLGWWIA